MSKIERSNSRPNRDSHKVRQAVVAAMLGALTVGVGATAAEYSDTVDKLLHPQPHTTEYLKDYKQVELIVESGQGANAVADEANPSGLSGQQRQDIIDDVQNQGVLSDSSGNPMLESGQVVVVPDLAAPTTQVSVTK